MKVSSIIRLGPARPGHMDASGSDPASASGIHELRRENGKMPSPKTQMKKNDTGLDMGRGIAGSSWLNGGISPPLFIFDSFGYPRYMNTNDIRKI
jgi:hypothetical protein